MESRILIVYKKEDEIGLAIPGDAAREAGVKIGKCLKIDDSKTCIIAQIFDLQYGASFEAQFAALARSSCIARCKIRGSLSGAGFSLGSATLPSLNAEVSLIADKDMLLLVGFQPRLPIVIGHFLGTSDTFTLDLAGTQGVTLITGKKGSGKSHFAKKLVEELVKNHAPVIVLDVNGEYAGLKKDKRGFKSGIADAIHEVKPTKNFFIPLDGIRFETFARMCQIEETHNAFRLFARYWNEKRIGKGLDDLQQYISDKGVHHGTINAATGRVEFARSLGIFGSFNLAEFIAQVKKEGGALVVNMFGIGQTVKELAIVYILNELIRAGENDEARIFLVAEEAQNYFEHDFWDEIITRMRHLGIYSLIVTNEPSTLPDMVFRQCDNLFAFHFANGEDIAHIAKAQVIDPESLSLLKSLGSGEAILIGKATGNFPFVVKISESELGVGGATKLLWKDEDFEV